MEQITVLFLNHKKTFKLMVHYNVPGLHKQNDTCFGSHYLSWLCLDKALHTLRAVAEDAQFLEWLSYQSKAKREAIADDLQNILQSSEFRERLQETIAVFKCGYTMLRQFDTSSNSVGHVYHSWAEMDRFLKDYDSTGFKHLTKAHVKRMHRNLQDRWEKNHSPIHAITYVSFLAFHSPLTLCR